MFLRRTGIIPNLLALFFFLFAGTVFAADRFIDCNESGCASSDSGAFFASGDDLWYPGKEVVKTLKLKNSSQNAWDMGIGAGRASAANDLENILHILIYLTDESDSVYSGTLAEFYALDFVSLPDFAGGEEREYSFRISMPASTPNANDYQDLTTGFSLTAGLVALADLPSPSPTSTPSSTPTSTPSTAPAGNGAGGGNEAPIGESSCGSPKPNKPSNLTASLGLESGQAVLFWRAPAEPPEYTYFLLAYGRNKTAPEWGNPNIGRQTSYKVSGLSAGTYYFWVRAGNGCMPGEFAGPAALALDKSALGAKPGKPAAGFAREVLGESTSSARRGALESAKEPLFPKTKPESINNKVQENRNNKFLFSIVFILAVFFSAVLFLIFNNLRRAPGK